MDGQKKTFELLFVYMGHHLGEGSSLSLDRGDISCVKILDQFLVTAINSHVVE